MFAKERRHEAEDADLTRVDGARSLGLGELNRLSPEAVYSDGGQQVKKRGKEGDVLSVTVKTLIMFV